LADFFIGVNGIGIANPRTSQKEIPF